MNPPAPVASGPRYRYSPRVRRLAAERGVDLDALVGTGPQGRVTPADVVRSADVGQLPDAPARQRAVRQVAPAAHGGVPASAAVTQVSEVDLTLVVALGERIASESRPGMHGQLAPTAVLAKAVLESLQVHPLLNTTLDAEGRVVKHDRQHLCVSFDTPSGPIAPVLRDAGALNLPGLARLLADMAERAQAGQIGPDELTGGTFALANIGRRGVLFETPILNPPSASMLSAGTPVERPVVVYGEGHGRAVAIRSVAYLALTHDLRAVQSAEAAQFLATVKRKLEAGHYRS